MMTTSELTILLSHTCAKLSKLAEQGASSWQVEDEIENLVKYISLRWPVEAGFLYAGYDQAKQQSIKDREKARGYGDYIASRVMTEG